MPTPTKGAQAAEKISDEIKSSRSSFWRPHFLTLKVGTYFMRPITDIDDLFIADLHQFFATKPKPEGYNGKWLETMWAVCQRDVMFRIRDEAGNVTDEFEDGYGDCYLHNAYAGKPGKYKKDQSVPDNQTLALVVEREPVRDASGGVTGFRDKLEEFKDKDGKIHKIPAFKIVSQKWSNYWAAVAASAFMAPRTICDKDFIVQRKEGENDYTITAVPPTPDHKPGTESWARYEEALKLVGGFDLGEFLIAHSTPDHYARWFDPDKTPEGGYGRREGDGDEGESGGEAAAASASPSVPDVSDDELGAFRGMLAGRGGSK
jgi:hypothetical protein